MRTISYCYLGGFALNLVGAGREDIEKNLPRFVGGTGEMTLPRPGALQRRFKMALVM